MDAFLLFLVYWSVIGIFAYGFGIVHVLKTKREALIQIFLLGPLFWISALICGINYTDKK